METYEYKYLQIGQYLSKCAYSRYFLRAPQQQPRMDNSKMKPEICLCFERLHVSFLNNFIVAPVQFEVRFRRISTNHQKQH